MRELLPLGLYTVNGLADLPSEVVNVVALAQHLEGGYFTILVWTIHTPVYSVNRELDPRVLLKIELVWVSDYSLLRLLRVFYSFYFEIECLELRA
jgi:hypothetical protein